MSRRRAVCVCAGTLGCLLLAVVAGCGLFSAQEPEYVYWEPALSPDGTLLAYESMTQSGLALFIFELASGVEQQVTFSDAPDWSPHWSPDGTCIVFMSRREDTVDLYLLVVETLETARLTRDQADNINPHWGSDGLIYFNSNRSGAWEILTVDPETREINVVVAREGTP